MEYQYSNCRRSNFFGKHIELQFGPFHTHHLSFALPETQNLPPVVFIGGAFQNAWSFRSEISGLIDLRPILLVELPGQGGNTQVCAEFGFTELVNLLAQLLDHLGLDKVLPVGLSYGAAIVHRFAVLHPERVEKLVLVGVAPRLPDSAYRYAQAFAWLLHQDRKRAFATAVTQHYQLERFDANLHRLHVEQLDGQPEPPTYVLAGRHDSFIPPHDAIVQHHGSWGISILIFQLTRYLMVPTLVTRACYF